MRSPQLENLDFFQLKVAISTFEGRNRWYSWVVHAHKVWRPSGTSKVTFEAQIMIFSLIFHVFLVAFGVDRAFWEVRVPFFSFSFNFR